MKGKTELLMNFKFLLIPIVEMLPKAIQSLCKFSFLKIVNPYKTKGLFWPIFGHWAGNVDAIFVQKISNFW
jgi:hypothetical protein